ncbi:hypothetical protein MHH70_01755 [Metasolibacillus sp. FSL H7-0170]|uniref:hypothetical protein n=1 Tax=Metasolibacillus sp. FSL H7-0170 TaxID=2921431 RepID=UPI0031587DEA
MERLKEFVALCEEREQLYSHSGFLFSKSDNEKIADITAAIQKIAVELNILSVLRRKTDNRLAITLVGGLNDLQQYCQSDEQIKYDVSKGKNVHFHKYDVKIGDYLLSAIYMGHEKEIGIEKNSKVTKEIERD